MKIAITAESTIDLTPELLKEFDIRTLPFTVLLGEEMGHDGEITPEKIFDYVDKTGKLPATAAINEFEYEEFFTETLKEYDAIVHFCLSSELSSAFVHAKAAAESLKNVFIVDTKNLSTAIALLAIYGRKLANEGNSPEEIVAKVNARVPNVQASFVVNTLDYLAKGGRCSTLAAFGANLLKIKPRIVVKDGKMSSDKKYRGKNNIVIDQYCKDTLKDFKNPDLSLAFLTCTSASPDMIEAALENLKVKGFKRIELTTAGATITSHCGPKCLGILYINDGLK